MNLYGLPYMGSKTAIADDIVNILPRATNLYDLFAGGCAISHCASLRGRYTNIYTNDITNSVELFRDAAMGRYKDEKRFISRKEFYSNLNDPYVRICFSFGCNLKNYMYSKDKEPVKRLAHDNYIRGVYIHERLQHIEHLNRVNSISLSTPVTISIGDYRDVVIKPDSVIYCDIPYKDTCGYMNSFDYEAFYSYCEQSKYPIFVSSYDMPAPFVSVFSINKRVTLSATNNSLVNKEQVFTLPRWQHLVTKQLELF